MKGDWKMRQKSDLNLQSYFWLQSILMLNQFVQKSVWITNKRRASQGFEEFNFLKWVGDSVAPGRMRWWWWWWWQQEVTDSVAPKRDNFKTVLLLEWWEVIVAEIHVRTCRPVGGCDWHTYIVCKVSWHTAEIKQMNNILLNKEYRGLKYPWH